MKILVIGANGRVGQKLIENLSNKNHEIIAGSRHPEQLVEVKNVTTIQFDLHDSVEALSQKLQDIDVIYYVAGSRGKDLLQTDSFGAVKSMIVAEKLGISRFIMLSSSYSLEPEKWQSPEMASLLDYNIAKFFADNYLINQTQLNYTILQATALIDVPATGRISINQESKSQNSIGNVALTLADVINHDSTSKTIFRMSDGNTPIDDALSSL
ncbi:NAD(P)H-binding protein [Leuconostoc gasicomitatum]|uniref:SDR family oxidoreductase n=1 Tax=Leuconostoc gasicomitatum TaxID=115778 RepID=A0A9Q3SZF7_9LACO|nr:NAD(P)H-binding protein [Leuconostoc gasicomitatum]MBZ5962916.1 SDR family oxidoreductase [Leuconostoc gasicomitatum]